MKIRISLVTALCCISFLAHANNQYNRPYIGIGLGGMQQFGKYSDNLNIFIAGDGGTNAPLNLNVPKGGNISTKAFIGTLNVGYSKLINPKAYLAFEAQANLRPSRNSFKINILATSGSTIQSQQNVTNSIKQLPLGFVMALKSGILLSPQLSIYGILGTEIARFKIESQANFAVPANNIRIPTSGSKSSTRYGLLLGLGLDSYMNDNLRMGVEYNYVNYGRVGSPKLNGSAANSAVGQPYHTLALSSKMRIDTHAFLVKLTYDL